MASIRLYSGDDGESHIEVIDPSSHPAWTEVHNATGVVFRACLRDSSATGTSPPAGSTLSPSPARRRLASAMAPSTGLAPETSTWPKT